MTWHGLSLELCCIQLGSGYVLLIMWLLKYDELKHYDHLPNMLLVLHMLPKHPQPCILQDPRRFLVVSGTKVLAADTLTSHLTDGQFD